MPLHSCSTFAPLMISYDFIILHLWLHILHYAYSCVSVLFRRVPCLHVYKEGRLPLGNVVLCLLTDSPRLLRCKLNRLWALCSNLSDHRLLRSLLSLTCLWSYSLALKSPQDPQGLSLVRIFSYLFALFYLSPTIVQLVGYLYCLTPWGAVASGVLTRVSQP